MQTPNQIHNQVPGAPLRARRRHGNVQNEHGLNLLGQFQNEVVQNGFESPVRAHGETMCPGAPIKITGIYGENIRILQNNISSITDVHIIQIYESMIYIYRMMESLANNRERTSAYRRLKF